MAQTDKAELVFESLAREWLARNPAIKHEWRPVKSRWWGNRLDLVCNPETENEVFATMHDNGQIAVGDPSGHEDFENFGRGLSERAIAEEAFAYFRKLLADHGFPDAAA
jgi:hypothetical protein